MMNSALRRAVLPLTACYFGIHYLQHSGVGPDFVRFYGKDLILVPLLTCATMIAAELSGRPQKTGTKEVVLTFVAVSVFFEGLLPYFSEEASGDLFDIAAYAAGAVMTILAIRSNKELRHSVWNEGHTSK